MVYVPGFENDVFISYAHADDRARLEAFAGRLQRQLGTLLGTDPSIWKDLRNLRESQQFDPEIVQSVRGSAVLVILTSPAYLRSEYCVKIECPAFEETLPNKKKRFQSPDLRNETFVFRVPMVPVPGDLHRELFPGVADIPFDDVQHLAAKIHVVLTAMRAECASVFLTPQRPTLEMESFWAKVTSELHKSFYAIEPFFQVGQDRIFDKSVASIHLIGSTWTQESDKWIQRAMQINKPWVAWSPRHIQSRYDLRQKALVNDLKKDPRVAFLESTSPNALWADILERIDLNRIQLEQTGGKKTVCVLHDSADDIHAGNVQRSYTEFHYQTPTSSARLIESDGVLVVWGRASQLWAPEALRRLLRSRAATKGLCVFDPEDDKKVLLDTLEQKKRKLHIVRQFGSFDAAKLDSFFAPLRSPR
jgi:hypothetical protein